MEALWLCSSPMLVVSLVVSDEPTLVGAFIDDDGCGAILPSLSIPLRPQQIMNTIDNERYRLRFSSLKNEEKKKNAK